MKVMHARRQLPVGGGWWLRWVLGVALIAAAGNLAVSHSMDDEGYWTGWWSRQPWLGAYRPGSGWLVEAAGVLLPFLVAPLLAAVAGTLLTRQPRSFPALAVGAGAGALALKLADLATGLAIWRSVGPLDTMGVSISILYGCAAAAGAALICRSFNGESEYSHGER